MQSIEYLGFLAAILTTGSFLPQAIMTLRTKNTDGISLTMYSLFTIGVAFWFIYGILLSSWSLIIANSITFLLAASILVVKFTNSKKDKA